MQRDSILLFLTRTIRLFSYGWLSVGLLLYLTELGYTQTQIGSLFTFTLLGDLVITFYLTTTADVFGRRNTLIIGALLKIFSGLVFAFSSNIYILIFAGTVGVMSPTGGEIGPFIAVEQAAITETIKDHNRITSLFGWYNLIGYIAMALGALTSGLTITAIQNNGYDDVIAYRWVLIGYAINGFIMLILYLGISHDIEPLITREYDATSYFSRFGLHRQSSKQVVFKLSLLFILDSFAGGFVMQTIIVYWFHTVYSMDTDLLGTMMMCANVFAGISALAATPLVKKIGAINTMVFTHLPSNIFLLLVPLMPNESLAVAMLLIRFCISQMDVPARQTYVALVVDADERSAAGGITNIVRSIGVALSPLLTGYLLSNPDNYYLFASPFLIAGGLKCLYDILLYVSFRLGQKVGSGQYSELATTDKKQTQTSKV